MAAPPGLTGLDAEKLKLVQDLEIEMMTDMYSRLTSACHKKCVPPKYHEVANCGQDRVAKLNTCSMLKI